ncbi:hypothetical protein HPB48_004598 [Haemaphysalis longicornis]|uniref:ATP synthase subunit d, mitochondrial n=1 Tax=Haemaphysalis longicornis TaxID=44386 RepID=A0A9J6FS98_HAELO|nr:hypothetical protein HPB48_004598 [Haemaphysalis longicornis]
MRKAVRDLLDFRNYLMKEEFNEIYSCFQFPSFVYKAFSVPFPKEHLTPKIDAEERAAKEEVEGFILESKERVEGHKKELARFEAMIPALHMTMEDYYEYFPEQKIDVDNPTFWPHDGSCDVDDSHEYRDDEDDH